MSDTGLLQETAEKETLKVNSLQYPPVFKQALYRLSWTKAPEALKSTGEKMKLAMQLSDKRAKASPDLDERYWKAWSKLQRENALD